MLRLVHELNTYAHDLIIAFSMSLNFVQMDIEYAKVATHPSVENLKMLSLQLIHKIDSPLASSQNIYAGK